MTTARATAVAPIGPVAVGSLLWRRGGALQLTAIVKAQFAFAHGAPMRVAAVPGLVERDEHLGGDPTCSLRAASDVVPYRERADVWLHGHAQAPGAPVSASMVRLAIYRARRLLLDKIIHVVGDRAHEDDPPEAFRSMPLTWERAHGGIGHEDNPVGVGADERNLLPNLVDPEDPKRPIGLAPISRYWKVRRRCLGGLDRRDLERGVIDVPDDFDWGYFQAAPRDQQLPYLRGDEWVVLDGMSSERVRLQSRLPKLQAAARWMPLDPSSGAAGAPFELVADTLAIDADAGTCSMLWRGSMPLADEARAGAGMVAGTLVAGDRAAAWSRAYDAVVAAQTPEPSPPELDESAVTTISEPDHFGQTMVDRGASSRSAESEASSRAPLPVDTEPGAPPEVAEDELPWVSEVAEEPAPDTDRSASRPAEGAPEPPRSEPRLSSLPPAPLDRHAYVRALREAGASEEDIEALLRTLETDGATDG